MMIVFKTVGRFLRYDIRDFTVRLRDRTEFRVMSMVYKKNYIRSNRTVDDIALIELNRQVDLTGVVSTVCLPTECSFLHFLFHDQPDE